MPESALLPDEMDTFQKTNETLTRRLLELTAKSTGMPSSPDMPSHIVLQDADAIVTHIEVNDKHGVGVLLRKLFGQCPNVVSIRSKNFYEGQQDFGDLHICLSYTDTTRDAVFWQCLQALKGTTVRRVLCVPYFPDDARTAVALKEIFGVPLCTYLMDDQNLCADGIPDDAMGELLAKSALRLAISPEMCAGYELKYGCKMHYMPPLVASRLVLPYLNAPNHTSLRMKAGVIVGNIWGQRWLELLRTTVRDSGVTLTWYCNGDFRWLPCSKESLVKDGIVPYEGAALPDEQLVDVLRQASFVVVPSGTLDDTDDRRFIAQLSFPSRIPYILASSQAPVLVLGSEATAAARFVAGAGIGMSAPYDRGAFQEAVSCLTRLDINLLMRRRALTLAGRFTDIGASEWIWQSLAKGGPVDDRYESMMPNPKPDLSGLMK